MTFFHRYRDNVKRLFQTAFLQVAVFCVAICCIFCHFDYLKTRARGRLSRWFSVPEWKVLRVDKDGHELGSVEQYVLLPRGSDHRTHTFKSMNRLYEPVEEHHRAALIALMDGKHDTGPRHCSQSPTPSDTPRGSFAGRRDTTQVGTIGVLRLPPDISPESLAAIQEFAELIHRMNTSKNTEGPSESCTTSPAQTQEEGPSRIDASPSLPSQPFSQYSIHPDSPDSSDCNPVPITPAPKTREPKLPPFSLQPSRKTRPFRASAHSQGQTIWMTTASYEDLPEPPEPTPEDEPGVLYTHMNLTDNHLQVWLLGNEKQWASVPLGAGVQHPTFVDRYLAIRSDGSPSWTTANSWNAANKWVDGR